MRGFAHVEVFHFTVRFRFRFRLFLLLLFLLLAFLAAALCTLCLVMTVALIPGVERRARSKHHGRRTVWILVCRGHV